MYYNYFLINNMLYTTDGNFIIKEGFETEMLKIKSKDDTTLDIFHYDANGNLRSGTKVNNNGDYEIWTGYCYDDNCSDESKKKAQLKIDKDGVTHLNKLCIENNCINAKKLDNLIKTGEVFNKQNTEKKMCIDEVCLTKKDMILFKFVNELMINELLKNNNTSIDKISEVELALILDEARTNMQADIEDEKTK